MAIDQSLVAKARFNPTVFKNVKYFNAIYVTRVEVIMNIIRTFDPHAIARQQIEMCRHLITNRSEAFGLRRYRVAVLVTQKDKGNRHHPVSFLAYCVVFRGVAQAAPLKNPWGFRLGGKSGAIGPAHNKAAQNNGLPRRLEDSKNRITDNVQQHKSLAFTCARHPYTRILSFFFDRNAGKQTTQRPDRSGRGPRPTWELGGARYLGSVGRHMLVEPSVKR